MKSDEILKQAENSIGSSTLSAAEVIEVALRTDGFVAARRAELGADDMASAWDVALYDRIAELEGEHARMLEILVCHEANNREGGYRMGHQYTDTPLEAVLKRVKRNA